MRNIPGNGDIFVFKSVFMFGNNRATAGRFVTFCNQKVTKEFWGSQIHYHID